MSFVTNPTRRRRRGHARPWLLTFAPLLLFIHADARAQTFTAGGHTVEVSLTPEKPEVMIGEPVFVTFEVRNASGVDLQTPVGGDYRNSLGRPDSYKLSATSEEGNFVRVIDAGPSMGGLVGAEKIPAGGSYRARLFLQHWVAFERPGTYTVVCKKSLSLSGGAASLNGLDAWASVDVEVKATVKVIPGDPAALGEVIEHFGAQLAEATAAESDYLANDRKASGALTALAFLEDKRVVPHLAAVMKLDTRRFDGLKFRAAHALSKYDDDAALAALVENMGDADDQMRQSVAGALSVSPHPRAWARLLSMRRDKYVGVRLTVVHALGKVKSEDTSALLREMSGDEDEDVRREARRYLSERGAEVR